MAVLDDLKQATDGLLYPSESDAEVEVVELGPGSSPPLEERDLPVEEISAKDFFMPLKETDDAPRWHLVHSLLALGLTDLRVIRIGEIQVEIYVVGKDAATGNWVGLRTHAVET